MTPRKLSKAAQDRIDAFDASARNWGWESDQGCNPTTVQEAEYTYKKTKADLELLVLQLQTRLKTLQRKELNR